MNERRPDLVSVVIPVHNGAAVIGEQLEALALQSYQDPLEVVVVDNRSTDDLAAALVPFRERLCIRLVAAREKAGVSHARNVGCRSARGDFLAVCDADDVVSPDWVSELVRAAADADLLGGPLRTTRLNPPKVQRWRGVSTTNGLPTSMAFLPFAFGANVAMWRTVFEETGGWDESFVAGGDDVEFGWRAQLSGFRLGFAPDAVVDYRLRATVSAAMRQKSAYSQSDAQLIRTHRDVLPPTRPTRALVTSLWWLASRSPYAVMFGSWRQGRWMVNAAGLWGRVRGSVRHRVWSCWAGLVSSGAWLDSESAIAWDAWIR